MMKRLICIAICLMAVLPTTAQAAPHGDISVAPVNQADVFSADVGSLSRTWCGAATAPDAPAPVDSVVVMYAHAADTPSRLSKYGSIMSRSVYDVSNAFSQASNGILMPRWQLGNDCSPNVLAIRDMTLAQPTAAYSNDPYIQVSKEIRPLIPRNTVALVFVDGINSKYGGQGELVGDNKPVNNANGGGGRMAIIWGAGGEDFLGSAEEPADSSLAGMVLHEMIHVLGGLQASAPNSTGGGHCNDAYDVMCYADGGQNQTQRTVCATPRVGWVIDCNNDDYFSMNPTGYLSDHWNTANSPFLCRGCINTPSVTANVIVPRVIRTWEPVTFGTSPRIPSSNQWNFGDSTRVSEYPTHWYTKSGQYVVRFNGIDGGTEVESTRTVTVKVSSRSPRFPIQRMRLTPRYIVNDTITYPPARIQVQWKSHGKIVKTTQYRWNQPRLFSVPRGLPLRQKLTLRLTTRVTGLKPRTQTIKLRTTSTGRLLRR